MPSSSVRTFTDPEEYAGSFREAEVTLTVTERGRLAWVPSTTCCYPGCTWSDVPYARAPRPKLRPLRSPHATASGNSAGSRLNTRRSLGKRHRRRSLAHSSGAPQLRAALGVIE